jgi:hypothetical protein
LFVTFAVAAVLFWLLWLPYRGIKSAAKDAELK